MSESEEPLVHICEVCGAQEILSPHQAYDKGWDYPPMMANFKILSPRTCPKCGIDQTLWWRIVVSKIDKESLTPEDLVFIERVNNEPDSIRAPQEEFDG
jgi:hypothetical protein